MSTRAPSPRRSSCPSSGQACSSSTSTAPPRTDPTPARTAPAARKQRPEPSVLISMLALLATANTPPVELMEVAPPVALPHEVLVRVRAFSLNRGEVVDLADAEAGSAVGWDLAGIVEQPDHHATLPVGTR